MADNGTADNPQSSSQDTNQPHTDQLRQQRINAREQQLNSGDPGNLKAGEVGIVQNQTGYELRRFRHPTENSERGQILPHTDAKTPPTLLQGPQSSNPTNDNTPPPLQPSGPNRPQPTPSVGQQSTVTASFTDGRGDKIEANSNGRSNQPTTEAATAERKPSLAERYGAQKDSAQSSVDPNQERQTLTERYAAHNNPYSQEKSQAKEQSRNHEQDAER